jgi:hypothetical protein
MQSGDNISSCHPKKHPNSNIQAPKKIKYPAQMPLFLRFFVVQKLVLIRVDSRKNL